MAAPKSTKTPHTSGKVPRRIKSASIDPLERILPAPRSEDEALRRDLFCWPGTQENAALAELAALERDGFDGMVASAARGLEASVMYERLSDESYRTQDEAESRFISRNHPTLLMHARLFAAGRLAERLDRRRRKSRRRS